MPTPLERALEEFLDASPFVHAAPPPLPLDVSALARSLPPEPESPPPALPPPLPLSERRVHARVELETDVSLHAETAFSGLAEDVSEGGIFVASSETHPAGTHLSLSFELPTGHRVQTVAEVRWLRDGGQDTRPGMGLRFATLCPEDHAAIQSFVEQRPPLLQDDG